jgi:phosphatidate cytidylyltransferase
MRDPRPATASASTRDHILVGVSAGAAAIATLIAGRLAVSIYVTVLLLVAYTDLRGLLAERGHMTTFALGAGGAAAFAWCGYTGDLELLPAFVAGLVLALLVTRIVLNEAGVQTIGLVGDLSATIGSAAITGVLGSHLLLLRAIDRVGFRGLLALGLMVVAYDTAAFFAGRWRGRHPLNKLVVPNKTWEGLLAGVGASVVVGLIVGLVLDPPFTLVSGVAFGLGVGILAPLGDLVFSTLKRSAGVKHSARYLGAAGGALDVIDSVLSTAPAFYWAFRTIAL